MCWGFQLATEDPSYLVRQRASLMPCPSPLSPEPLSAAGSCRRSPRRCGGICNEPRATAGLSRASRRCHLPAWHRQLCGSSGGTSGFAWTEASARLGAGDPPALHAGAAHGDSRYTQQQGPGGSAQAAPLSRSLPRPPEGPRVPSFPEAAGPQREGCVPGSVALCCPGMAAAPRALPAPAAPARGHSPGAAAPVPAPSVPQRAAPASEPLAGGGTYILSRKVTAARHGGARRKRCWGIWGSSLSRSAWLADGTLQWLSGKSQGLWLAARYLQCVKWGCWGARASARPGGGRGPAGNGRSRPALPQHSPARSTAGSGRSRPFPAAAALPALHSRLFEPLLLAAVAIARLMSQSWLEEAVPQSLTSLEEGFYVKKAAERQSLFSQSFSTTQGARGAKCGRTNLLVLPLHCPCEERLLDRCSKWQLEWQLGEDLHGEVMTDRWNILLKRRKTFQHKRCFCKISPEPRSTAQREVGLHPCGAGSPLGPGQNPPQPCCIRSCTDTITTCVGFLFVFFFLCL